MFFVSFFSASTVTVLLCFIMFSEEKTIRSQHLAHVYFINLFILTTFSLYTRLEKCWVVACGVYYLQTSFSFQAVKCYTAHQFTSEFPDSEQLGLSWGPLN